MDLDRYAVSEKTARAALKRDRATLEDYDPTIFGLVFDGEFWEVVEDSLTPEDAEAFISRLKKYDETFGIFVWQGGDAASASTPVVREYLIGLPVLVTVREGTEGVEIEVDVDTAEAGVAILEDEANFNHYPLSRVEADSDLVDDWHVTKGGLQG